MNANVVATDHGILVSHDEGLALLVTRDSVLGIGGQLFRETLTNARRLGESLPVGTKLELGKEIPVAMDNCSKPHTFLY